MLLAFVVLGVLAPFCVLALARFLEEETAVRPSDRREPLPGTELPPDADVSDR